LLVHFAKSFSISNPVYYHPELKPRLAMQLIYFVFAVLAGAALTVQIGVNNQLRAGLGHPVLATIFSFLIGFTAMVGVMIAARPDYRATWGMLGNITWWKWLGGLLGAGYVLSTIVLVPRIGAGNLTGLAIAGQLVLAIVADHYGWLGFPQHPATLLRIVGALLLLLGVYLIMKF
jgi:bacterial/archaeal transporter family-2 protein